MDADHSANHGNLTSLRSRILIVALAVLLTSALTIWMLSVISYRTGISRSVARLQSYKAEQLLDFVQSQLELLDYLELRTDPAYFSLAENSIRSFAYGMLRSPAEIVILLREPGNLVFATSSGREGERSDVEADPDDVARVAATVFAENHGWAELEFDGTRYIGETHRVTDSGLGFFIALEEREFFREQRSLTLQNTLALLVLGASGAVTIGFALKRMLQPLTDVSLAMREVAVTKDFQRNVEVDTSDEIGALAAEFNGMTTELGYAYERLKDVADSEARLRGEVSLREYETLEVLGRATEYKDPETGRHILRVGIYAALIAAELGEDEEQQDLIRHAAPLHDIGKLGIPDSILLKPAKLTPEEFSTMTEHTRIAHRILKDSESKYLRAGAIIGLTHHEHWDGSGYPEGIAREEIPLLGRIVGLVDMFDALISRRPYKDPWKIDAAFAEIRRVSGTNFDPAVVEAFFSISDEIREVVDEYRDDYQ